MNACPELVDLHAFVDGQLDGARWRDIDRHQRDCASCRDALRSIARLNRELLRPAAVDLGPRFEQNFRAGLYERMVASDDLALLRRRQRRDLVLAAGMVALLVIALPLITRLARPEPVRDRPAVIADAAAPTSAGAAGVDLRDRLARFLDGLGPRGPERGDRALDRLALSYSAAGRNLVGDLAEEAAVSSPDREAAALNTLARLGDARAIEAIRSHIDEDPRPGPRLERGLAALIATGSPAAVDRIVAAEKAGLPLARSLQLLHACPGTRARRAFAELVDARLADARAELTSALAGLEGAQVDRLLVEIALGEQGNAATAALLAGRSGARALLRQRAEAPAANAVIRERAIGLIGMIADEGDRATLVRLAAEPRFADEAVVALAGLGGVEGVERLVLRLEVESGRDLESLIEDNRRLLGRIAALELPGLDYIRREVGAAQGARRAAFILALGARGEAVDRPVLMAIVRQAEFERHAIAALVLLDSGGDREFIRGLTRDRDPGLRRLAREALNLLEPDARPEPSWSGFAAVREPVRHGDPRAANYHLPRVRDEENRS